MKLTADKTSSPSSSPSSLPVFCLPAGRKRTRRCQRRRLRSTPRASLRPRHEFFYFSDDGNLVALRYNQWKIVFAEQRAHGFEVWRNPFVPLRLPKLFNLRSDPFETADHEGMDYERWAIEHIFLLVPAQQYVALLDDWNLSPAISAETFAFSAPAGAKAVTMSSLLGKEAGE